MTAKPPTDSTDNLSLIDVYIEQGRSSSLSSLYVDKAEVVRAVRCPSPPAAESNPDAALIQQAEIRRRPAYAATLAWLLALDAGGRARLRTTRTSIGVATVLARFAIGAHVADDTVEQALADAGYRLHVGPRHSRISCNLSEAAAMRAWSRRHDRGELAEQPELADPLPPLGPATSWWAMR